MSRADVFPSPVPPVSASSNATSSLPKEEQESLKASIFQRLHPRVYLERFVAENVRPDGRQFAEWRDVSINVGTCTHNTNLMRYFIHSTRLDIDS
jgi:polyribonucleotide nucleotidyltransferase